MLKESMLQCDIRPGLFDNEYVASVPARCANDSKNIEFVTDKQSVSRINATNKAFVRVWLVCTKADVAEVILPASAGSSTMRIHIAKDLIRQQ
jgi:hypothetical protein